MGVQLANPVRAGFDPSDGQIKIYGLEVGISSMAQPNSVVHFSGHEHFRNRLVLSILSGRHVKIDKIRSDDKNPGLRGTKCMVSGPTHLLNLGTTDFEVSLLRLLEKVTNGTIIEISVTGASPTLLALASQSI